jgi:predicted enzyme related to lactoylglutathione lyase
MAERVVHFEITADDPERAVRFYRDVFGWEITKFEGADYWLITTGAEGPGIDGAIMPRTEQPVINTVAVDGRLEDAIARVERSDGKPAGEIMDIPGVGRFSYVTDTEGNVFGLMEPTA